MRSICVLTLVLLTSACSDDAPYSPTTVTCDEEASCPDGQTCQDGACVLDDGDTGGTADTGTDTDDVGIDMGRDTVPDVPEVEIGAPCDDDDDCPSGFCIEQAGDARRVCTDFCDPGEDGCPDGWVCAAVTNSGADRVFLCFPETEFLCTECESDGDCGGRSDRCIDYPDGRFCARDCGVQACPDGYDCVDLDGPDGPTPQCRSQEPVCSPCFDPDNDGYGVGPECRGDDCAEGDPLAFDGAEERCNGQDDNCDGTIDETFDFDNDPRHCGDCETVCEFEGAEALCELGECVRGPCLPDRYDIDGRGDNGCEYFCELADPAQEVCNGRDDDCNGAEDDGNPGGGGDCDTEEDGVCAAGVLQCTDGELVCEQLRAPAPEVCNGEDDNCDGMPDDGNPGGGAACNTGADGICNAGTLMCLDGDVQCMQDRPARQELCNLLDDNCNGRTDEDNPEGGGDCDTEQDGLCAAGTWFCRAGELACERNRGPVDEVCNGEDDNCNGTPDEGDPGGGGGCDTEQNGVCAAGTQHCRGGGLVCDRDTDPSGESCNGLDDDCNGTVDNGCPSSLGTGSDRSLTSYGGNGGSTFRLVCPSGQMAVGVDIRSASELDRVQVICQALTLNEDRGSDPYTYQSAATGGQSRTASAGGGGGSQSTLTCPAGSFLHRTRVRSGSRIDQLSVTCARIDYVGYPANGSLQRTDTLTQTYGGNGGTLRSETRCANNQFISGFYGRAGSRVDRIGPICRTVSVGLR
jgi:hypothetical protein